MPCVDYCSEIWGNTYRSNILCISFANESGKNDYKYTGANARSDTDVLFIGLNLFYGYIEYKPVAFMYRVKFGLVSTNIAIFLIAGKTIDTKLGRAVILYSCRLRWSDNEGHVFACCWWTGSAAME